MSNHSMASAAGADGGTVSGLSPETNHHQTQELTSAGAPAAGEIGGDEEQQSRQFGSGGCDGDEEKEKVWLREMRGSLLVVASLLASVTYQAGMNPPGGLWQDNSPDGSKNPHRAGDPVLRDTDSARFQVFNIFNSFAFAYSVGTMMQLVTESVVVGWPGGSRRFRRLIEFGSVMTMKYMMILSLLYLGVAFAAGSCRNRWCSLAASSPLYYFLSCVSFDLLYSLYRRKQQKKSAAPPVEVAVEQHGHRPS